MEVGRKYKNMEAEVEYGSKVKVTTAVLAKDMKFWAHMGHPCGQDFMGAPFYKLHPEYQWQSKFLNNMLSYPWTLFEAKK